MEGSSDQGGPSLLLPRLRWINAGLGARAQKACMMMFRKSEAMVPQSAALPMAELSGALASVPAAWPAGVSNLARALNACQRSDRGVVCGDWLAATPNAVALPGAMFPQG